MADNVLYFPTIIIPKSDWLFHTILYYDNIGTIVPISMQQATLQRDPFISELHSGGYVDFINPMDHIRHLSNLSSSFGNFLHSADFNLAAKQVSFSQNQVIKSTISADKFDAEMFYLLKDLGLASTSDHKLFQVEKSAASYLMAFLATILGEKLNRLPVTDDPFSSNAFSGILSHQLQPTTHDEIQSRRIKTLEHLMPAFNSTDLRKVLEFKSKHVDDLRRFKLAVEELALNPDFSDTARLENKLAILNEYKIDLIRRMKEISKPTGVFLKSVLGLAGAVASVAALTVGAPVTAILLALAPLTTAIYDVINAESPGNVIDQHGMKFLALMNHDLKLA